MKQRLFVYGTLGLGKPNEHILKNIGGEFEKASVKGFLHDKGWGAAMGCPAIRLDANGDKVEGFVFSSENIAQHWQALDKFEGEEYQRVLTKVALEDKTEVEAFIYTLK